MYYKKITRSLSNDILWISVDYDYFNESSIFESSVLDNHDSTFSPDDWDKKRISNNVKIGVKLILNESTNL